MAAPMLTKTELVDAMLDVEESGVTKRQVNDVLECLAYVAAEEIKQGNRFRIPNVGTIDVRLRKGTKKGTLVRNPSTGEMQKSAGKPASTRVGFRALKALRDALPSPAKAKSAMAKGER